ncbi:MAG: PsbP-related protein [Methanobacterium sp.]
MKKYAFFIIAILALVVFASGCTSSGNQTSNQQSYQPTVPTKNYTANGISFSYPDGWEELKSIATPNAVVAYGDPKSVDAATGNVNTLMVVQKVALPSGTTLKKAYDDTYSQYAATDPSFQQISDKTITIDGTTAYENIHKVSVSGVQKQERAVWLEKGGQIYVILCGALPDAFAAQQANFDAVINTFKVV